MAASGTIVHVGKKQKKNNCFVKTRMRAAEICPSPVLSKSDIVIY